MAGAATGIGAATATRLGQEGARVYGCCRAQQRQKDVVDALHDRRIRSSAMAVPEGAEASSMVPVGTGWRPGHASSAGESVQQPVPPFAPLQSEGVGQGEEVVVAEAAEEFGGLLDERLAQQDVAQEDVHPLTGAEGLGGETGEFPGGEVFERLGQLTDLALRGTPRLRAQPVLLRQELAEVALVGAVRSNVDESL
ncbi:hypothetical protein [Streptomyces griseorubiginosus]|uniref:hypothetical protein n=1 Tax=Streptomyces griseorubiginosus TaxID=67304 RepID=UPI0034D489AA